MGSASADEDYDAVVIGGGFAGIYALHKLRSLGFKTHLVEAGSALGGVWHWNSYPGARVDSEVPFYQLSIPEVWRNWTWSERFPGHAEIKRYFQHVDGVLGVGKDASLDTVVTGATFDARAVQWLVTTSTGRTLRCTYLVPATGSSHKRYTPAFAGMDTYRGRLVHSAVWPAGGLDLAGKRVAVVGAGATGVQCVQEIAKVAAELTVYIRNPNIAIPMGQRAISTVEAQSTKSLYKSLFGLARQTAAGVACDAQTLRAGDHSPAEREVLWNELWARGGFNYLASNYADTMLDPATNRMVYDFWAQKVRAKIRDPAKRDVVAPLAPPYVFGTKRSSLEQDYYECLDRDSVQVVGLKAAPIRAFAEHGIVTEDGTLREHDVVVLATGFDNITGSLTSMGLCDVHGKDVKSRWADGVSTYLGIMMSGFPNLFMIFGPQGVYGTARRMPNDALMANVLVHSPDGVDKCARLHREPGRSRGRLLGQAARPGHHAGRAQSGLGGGVEDGRPRPERADAVPPQHVVVHGRQHPGQEDGAPQLRRRHPGIRSSRRRRLQGLDALRDCAGWRRETGERNVGCCVEWGRWEQSSRSTRKSQ